jgi:DNA repair exonuclease SbcCD nuclease subunit
MKIVVASDLHADWTSLGVSRFAEVEESAHKVVDHAVRVGAEAFLFPGDLADPDTGGGTFRAQALAVEMAMALAHHDIISVWLSGNHDVCEDGTGQCVLAPLGALSMYEPKIHVATRPRVVWLDNDVAVLCLPFIPASHGVDMAEAARELWPEAHRIIVLSHLTIPGIVPGTETNDMPRGREVLYPLAETVRAAARIQGHYHQRQMFDPGDGGPPIIIPGALARLGFGEQDHDPGFIVLDV